MKYYQHDINPFLVHNEWLVIPWYWLFYVLGFFGVWILSRRLSSQGWATLSRQDLADYLVGAWFGMLVGARIGYILIYHLDLYLANPTRIFAFWEGGMSFHGGVLGIGLSTIVINGLKGRGAWQFLDLLACSAPLALGLGRIANFINGELVGRPSELPWAVIFLEYDSIPRHPSQLYQALGEGLLLACLMWMSRQGLVRPSRQTNLFLISYGLIRLLTEFFREPDPQLGLLWLGLTMGQILCVLMIIVGACLLWTRRLIKVH